MNTANKTALTLCKDCAHFVGLSKTEKRFTRCAAPQQGVDPVFGQPVMPACEHQRDSDGKGRCGQSGVFFVTKASASAETSEASANKTALPVCKDCAHFVGLSKTEKRFTRCAAPQQGVDPVFGQPVMPACEHQREYPDGKGRCGQSGVFFVAKASASAETSEASS